MFYTVILPITKKGSFLNPGFDLVMAGKNRHPVIGVFSVNIAILILQVKSRVQINKNSSVFHQIVDYVIPKILKYMCVFLLLQWEILSAEDSYKCTIYEKF